MRFSLVKINSEYFLFSRNKTKGIQQRRGHPWGSQELNEKWPAAQGNRVAPI